MARCDQTCGYGGDATARQAKELRKSRGNQGRAGQGNCQPPRAICAFAVARETGFNPARRGGRREAPFEVVQMKLSNVRISNDPMC
jgi:hypothetical protein